MNGMDQYRWRGQLTTSTAPANASERRAGRRFAINRSGSSGSSVACESARPRHQTTHPGTAATHASATIEVAETVSMAQERPRFRKGRTGRNHENADASK